MTRRCATRWGVHTCARPPHHEGTCDCFCGTWRGQPDGFHAAAYHRPQLPA